MGARSEFKFTQAQVSLSFFNGGKPLSLPPIGSGWFDTIYLDDDLRCDYNSRGDILVFTT